MEGTDLSSRRVFVIFINIRSQKWLGFLLMLFQISYIDLVKKLVQHLTKFDCLGGCCCIKSLENFSCSFIQNLYGKFYSHLGILIFDG